MYFYTILYGIALAIFIVAAIITFLGILKFVSIDKYYLGTLFSVLLVGVVSAMVGFIKAHPPSPGTNSKPDTITGTMWYFSESILPTNSPANIVIFLDKNKFVRLFPNPSFSLTIMAGTPEQTSWEEHGTNISFKYGEVEYTGIIENGADMAGKADENLRGKHWTWNATKREY